MYNNTFSSVAKIACQFVHLCSSSLESPDLANRRWGRLFLGFTCAARRYLLHCVVFVPGSVSVPSVTVVAVASWVRAICKRSASHLSLKRSSATRTEEARRAIAVMVIRPLSQKCLERPPQDREDRKSESHTASSPF